jgi:hypothetical protein
LVIVLIIALYKNTEKIVKLLNCFLRLRRRLRKTPGQVFP